MNQEIWESFICECREMARCAGSRDRDKDRRRHRRRDQYRSRYRTVVSAVLSEKHGSDYPDRYSRRVWPGQGQGPLIWTRGKPETRVAGYGYFWGIFRWATHSKYYLYTCYIHANTRKHTDEHERTRRERFFATTVTLGHDVTHVTKSTKTSTPDTRPRQHATTTTRGDGMGLGRWCIHPQPTGTSSWAVFLPLLTAPSRTVQGT
jgi:hypothetical protein